MERSYGVIPCHLNQDQWEVFLIEDHHGNWGFPKGHPNKDEEGKEAALRELKEETNLSIESWLDHPPFVLKYIYGKAKRHKEVYLYPALVSGEAKPQALEIATIRSVPLDQGEELVSFKETKQIFPILREILKSS